MLRGYGPLLGVLALFVLIAGVIPSVDRPEQDLAAGPGTRSPAANGDAASGTTVPPARDGGPTATTPGAPASSPTTGAPGVTTGGVTGSPPVTNPGRGAGACAGRDVQVPNDPYSPPCVEFEGDNGGATHRGVAPGTVTVAFRVLDEKGFQQTLASLAGAEITDRPADIKRTATALAEYFNGRFQFYGRQIDIAFYDGAGSSTDELLGGGQAEAEIDAEHVAKEIGAFAELNGASAPFTDALARQGVVAFGTPYLSREWHMQRRPYNWSISTDCSIVAEIAAELAIKQLAGKPAAFAGGNLEGEPRKLAGVSPENPWYQECHDAAIKMLRDNDVDPGLKINYKLDINSMSNQAASVIAKLKSEGATTVLCGCDPIFPVFLSAKAAEQNYFPEWVVLGTALTDWDVVGQLYDQDQWSRAFGVSALGSPLPLRAGLGYSAYKTVRDDEPAFAVEVMYAQMYLLALGIQMAGPNLTPATFEQGMFNYPGGTGPFGTWGFDATSYTPTRDYRVIWWDPDRTSPVNNKAGAYVESYNGQRFPLGSVPVEQGQPPVFAR